MSEKWIRASEIGDYLYCRRAWWLKRLRGVPSQNVRALQRGERHHRAHGRLVYGAEWSRRIAYLLFFLGIAVLVLLLAVMFWSWSRRLARSGGLPEGRVVYTDAGAWFPNEETLYARHLRLVGRPDYLVEQADGTILPVEIKSRRAPREPYETHLLQLAAYCLLVEENYGRRPPYGIIQYKDQAFAIDYTVDLEADLVDLLHEMRGEMLLPECHRDHTDWARCAHCSVRTACTERLG